MLSQKSVDEAENYKDEIVSSMNFYMDDVLADMQNALNEAILKNNKTFEDCQARLEALYRKLDDNRQELAPMLSQAAETNVSVQEEEEPDTQQYYDEEPEEDDF